MPLVKTKTLQSEIMNTNKQKQGKMSFNYSLKVRHSGKEFKYHRRIEEHTIEDEFTTSTYTETENKKGTN